ncbi:MAG TPA: choice-of-anchor Q domain-containing protein, partial [Lacipirellulaceae bacterium]|jgi:hypothetical protein|nr:choice-of-anchor Q domain-containing protein [Lacipirellulaceae bacterium]
LASSSIINPQLGPLANNGGQTQTRAPLPGSPVINAGDPAAVAGANGVPTNDQRGVPFTRVYGRRIDIGAFESQPNPLPGDFDYNGTVDSGDYLVWRIAETRYDPRADANGDGRVDDSDLAVWRANFGNAYAASAALVAAVTPQSVRVAAPQMMADHAEAEAHSGSPESAFAHFVPMFEASAGEGNTPLARRAVGDLVPRDSLTLLGLDDGPTERRVVDRVFGRRRNDGDSRPDRSWDGVAVVDEVFAELGGRCLVVRSV